ncbi:hypothetical protein [Fredinandcohnia quinoae]|uniref:Uncharacterized protein n=1 Tax=Fredinandcohnia quinoae TaxID=2918902 RepID=A0AAW5EC35_9BACI|nr:hypothetical protein [Fredinandcohnia sp. SECRCQ15]MCH1626334.1 hypothetical protein [Fredinandcohnia sp. SECRCQ15]
MGKKICWAIIFVTIALNVVMLHHTVEAYFGKEYDHVYQNTAIAVASSLIAFVTYLYWRKLEYKK